MALVDVEDENLRRAHMTAPAPEAFIAAFGQSRIVMSPGDPLGGAESSETAVAQPPPGVSGAARTVVVVSCGELVGPAWTDHAAIAVSAGPAAMAVAHMLAVEPGAAARVSSTVVVIGAESSAGRRPARRKTV
jgi:hypothetical protein